jgi:hypothetical protein
LDHKKFQKVGAVRMKRVFSSFLHHLSSLLTPDMDDNGSNVAYTSND